MQQIIQVRGSKGGVGKSMMSIALLHCLLEREKDLLLIETDEANPDVAKVYRRDVHTIAVSLSTAQGWAELSNVIEAHKDRIVVINTRAADQESVSANTSRFWRAAKALSCRVVTFWVISRDFDPVLQLSEYLKTVPDGVNQITHVVKNLYHSPDGRFPTYEGSNVKSIIEQGGGRDIKLPIMAVRNRERIYDKRETIREILDNAPIGDRIEMELWVEELIAAIGGIIDD